MVLSTVQRLKKLGLRTKRGLYDYEIDVYADQFNIRNYRGVCDRQRLPDFPWQYEAIIVNLDDVDNPGTHWVAMRKVRDIVIYFDSYGDLPPPKEILHYYRKYDVFYNHRNYQNNNSVICGQLCLEFLINTSKMY